MKRRRGPAALALVLLAAAPAAAQDGIDLGALAQCVADSGARFYGAHWCPYCRKQKEWFGRHAGALPYVECYDGPESEGMNDLCTGERIRSFPTWEFANGERETGAKSPRELASFTGCPED